jgi:hypothetical protein
MSTPSLRRASAALARAASSSFATTRLSSSLTIAIACRPCVTSLRRDDFFDAAVKSSSSTTTTYGAAFRAHVRAYASKGKKASKSKSSQGKRTKGKGMGALPISAKAEQTTKGNKNIYLEALTKLEATDIEEDLTPEELEEYAARAKAYSREKMRAERAFHADINEKIRIKKAAIAALPAGATRDAAMVEDEDLFPLKRKLPMYTPAIPGFYEEKQRLAEEAVSGGAALKK